jgi:biopolymer transport protein ExbD
VTGVQTCALPIYPFGKLTETLRSYRSQCPDTSENLVLAADPVVPYSAVVAAMDAARKDAQGSLFPGVTLALAIQ